ncbi:hypothetical protein AB0M39_38045 [Streptomyces sp. NPDC051907]|uniref:hypothetical protein n=1 Tax=Streptomyces sp. NPDC051907 TaxID=3155284 RepID=UPI003446AF23
MMTGTPGRSAHHHPGDGCTGQHRNLTLAEGKEIQSLAERMMTHAALADTHARIATAPGPWDALADEGSYLARHYGPDGEWLLSSQLARHITLGRNRAPSPPFDLPQLAARCPEGDPQAAALLATLASRYREPSTTDEQLGHLGAARLPLQAFVLHMHTGHYRTAHRQWTAAYHADTGAPPLRALAFTTLLVLWASRCALVPEGWKPFRRASAPLN